VLSPWQWFFSTRTFSNNIEATLTALALSFWPWDWMRSFSTVKVRADAGKKCVGTTWTYLQNLTPSQLATMLPSSSVRLHSSSYKRLHLGCSLGLHPASSQYQRDSINGSSRSCVWVSAFVRLTSHSTNAKVASWHYVYLQSPIASTTAIGTPASITLSDITLLRAWRTFTV